MKSCCVSFEEVISVENLCAAWEEFIRGKRKKKDVQEFGFRLGDEIVALHEELQVGTYKHGPYHHFSINDPKPRSIHKALVRDRLLHHAIHRKLYPFFFATFIADSFSCQKGKGVHKALDCFRRMAWKVGKNQSRPCWVLKCDIRKFFASVDHAMLIHILNKKIMDRRVLGLLKSVIGSFFASPGKGIPLGNLTSQLFANVYLNELDQYVKHGLRINGYIRYADDFVFLSPDREELLVALPKVSSFLQGTLHLDLHPDKVWLKTLASGVDFLGWVHFPYHRILRTKTKKRMLKRLVKNPESATFNSYEGMLKHGNAYGLGQNLLNQYWFWQETQIP